MKSAGLLGRAASHGRSPHGERGLKCRVQRLLHRAKQSLPSRGAWIEIGVRLSCPVQGDRRSPHGERGLKLPAPRPCIIRRRPSLPTRGAWIEIGQGVYGDTPCDESLPSRGAWIEIRCPTTAPASSLVAPLAGAWIEMSIVPPSEYACIVAPLAGAWIEIARPDQGLHQEESLPSRGRGLKWQCGGLARAVSASLPSRGRGLK